MRSEMVVGGLYFRYIRHVRWCIGDTCDSGHIWYIVGIVVAIESAHTPKPSLHELCPLLLRRRGVMILATTIHINIAMVVIIRCRYFTRVYSGQVIEIDARVVLLVVMMQHILVLVVRRKRGGRLEMVACGARAGNRHRHGDAQIR